MLFGHPRIRVPELRRDDAHRDAAHCQRRRIGVAQNVERRGGHDLRALGCGVERALLMGWSPELAVVADEDRILAGLARCQPLEERAPFVCQSNMARLASLDSRARRSFPRRR